MAVRKALVGSTNPVKIAAVREALAHCFGAVEVEGIEVASGVAGQPIGEETFTGAENRAWALAELNRARGLDAQLFVGVEGGVAQAHGHCFGFGVICVLDERGRLGFGVSPQFQTPPDMTADLLGGAEMGDLVDALTGQRNTRQAGGAVGYLTGGRVDRRTLIAQGAMMALIPFLNERMYFTEATLCNRSS